PRHSPSFPTRRSSDLVRHRQVDVTHAVEVQIDDLAQHAVRLLGDLLGAHRINPSRYAASSQWWLRFFRLNTWPPRCSCVGSWSRSEEHTSELQSRGHL